jgi:hypothetical protein
VAEALEGIASLLQTHEEPEHGLVGVCLHRDRFPTVSSTLIAIGVMGPKRYLHAAGPPCTTPYEDFTELIG